AGGAGHRRETGPGQQGVPGRGWSAGAQAGGAGPDRAGGFGALGAGPVPAGRPVQRSRTAGADRFRWPVPGPEEGRPGRGDGGAGAGAPHVVDGQRGDDQLGHPGEQGAGADRGAPAVRGALRPHRRVVHPQSIVHSMVTFADGSTLAQASPPDMKLPIALALSWPDRVPGAAPACDFSTASTWTFEPVDNEVFPAVELARQAGERGGCLTAVYNAANEEAAAAFLAGRIRFP